MQKLHKVDPDILNILQFCQILPGRMKRKYYRHQMDDYILEFCGYHSDEILAKACMSCELGYNCVCIYNTSRYLPGGLKANVCSILVLFFSFWELTSNFKYGIQGIVLIYPNA